MEYPIGSPTCWNASNINCTAPHNGPQCSYGCTQDAAQTITDMAAYDGGMRLFNVGGGQSSTPQAEMHAGEWKRPSAAGGAYSAACWFYGRDIYNGTCRCRRRRECAGNQWLPGLAYCSL